MLAEPLRSGCHANERRRRSACPACAADDLVLRDFAPSAANQLRAAEDVKYVPTAAGWLSSAAVVDCFSCRVVGWSMRDGSRAQPGRRRARDGRRAPTTSTGRPNQRLSTEAGAVQRLQPGWSTDFSRLASRRGARRRAGAERGRPPRPGARLVCRPGVRVERVMTDNGSAYRAIVHALAYKARRSPHRARRGGAFAWRMAAQDSSKASGSGRRWKGCRRSQASCASVQALAL